MKFAIALVAVLVASATAQKCGQRNTYSSPLISALTPDNGETYIVGGSEARPNEFPWQISFQIYYSESWWQPKKWMHNCGGSIINDQWILTAAHCHVFPSKSDYRIVVGAHNIAKKESTTQTFKIDRIVLHPGWDDDTLQDDIALIKIVGRINLDGRTAAPVCLPTAADSNAFDNSICVTSGWGKTSDNGYDSDVLLKVDLPIVSNPVCSIRYRNVRDAQITDTKICAGRVDRAGLGVCQGDSGGPLVCLSGNDGYKLAGITSFGVVCGSQEHPAVYTRVSQYRNWVDAVIARY